MEGSNTEVILEKACEVSTPLSLVVCMKQVTAVTAEKETIHQLAMNHVVPTTGSTQARYISTDIQVTLENESVWSRFHSLGTEMILTKQGRRMFPCCRFRLSGLEPARKYSLIMDIMPVNDFTHKWNGKIWEPVALSEPHVPGNVCVHPESPALGQQWMESPVSFYKVKLANEFIDQEDCLYLRPMHRYQPRLYVVPVDSEEPAAPDSPNAKMFTFPVTEFYAVTSYQNPQITQLKIDCNPFAMAFREDSRSIRLVQNKFQLRTTVGGTNLKSPVLSLARSFSMKRKDNALKNAATACSEDNSQKGPISSPPKETKAQTSHAASSYSGDIILCKETSACRRNEVAISTNETNPALVESVASSDIEPSENKSFQEPLQSTEEAVLLLSDPEASKSISDDANVQLSSKSPDSDDFSQIEENLELDYVDFSLESQISDEHNITDQGPQKLTEAKKAKSPWWSNVKTTRHHSATTAPNISLKPDLDDVEGVLFVSFGAKNTLNNDAEDVERRVLTSLPSPTLDGLDHHDAEDARISKLERILRHDLREMRHRQVIHPLLQDVGMKLSLLNPTLAIDLQYLGVQLPFPSPVHNGFSSPDAACSFVSRTGKTNDPTKIKGWRERFSPTQSAPEALKNSSAFCSDMLDEYLEKEAQQISNRVAVFSSGSTLPVSYQLPSKSSSYIVTLDSRLKTQSALTKDCSNPSIKRLSKPLRTGSPVSHNGLQGHKAKGADKLQAQAHVVPSAGSSHKPGANKHLSKLQENCKSSVGVSSSLHSSVTSAKMYSHVFIKNMEEEAFHHGKDHTHITARRAKFALRALLNFQKCKKRPKYRTQHDDGCLKEFCRLGCICDSLHRESRGPTHCRRADCMFECKCFKHKVLLFPPSKETAVQQGKKRGFVVFPIRDSKSEDRPPPAPSITTLWEKTTDDDPDPVFIPTPAKPPKKNPRLYSSVSQPIHQIPEEDKDPVYLYFESMMTCARVREFNSNPPMQIHMVPVKKTKETKQLSSLSEAGESHTSEKISEDTPTVATDNRREPEPTKLLEILSECNWEPHRNLVLSALFRQMNSSLLSEPFFIGKYKVQLLSTKHKQGDRSATITYKVCVSQAKENEVNEGSWKQFEVKRTKRAGEPCTEEDVTDSADVAPQRRSSSFISKPPRKLFSLINHFSLDGYLNANKKKAGRPAVGHIRVNGKVYNQAKVLLGQMGALHPVNRYAAFVTGRLQQEAQDQPKSVHAPKSSVPGTSGLAPSRPAPKRDGGSNFAPRTVRSMLARKRRSQLNNASSAPAAKALVLDGSQFVLPPGLLTIKPTADPSGAATQGVVLPPRQKVVLQPVPGTAESNFLCQYNGQILELVPIGPEVHSSPVCAGSQSQTSDTTDPSKVTASTQKPLISSPVTNYPPKMLPIITPRVLSLSGSSGMNIANGIPAIKLLSGFSGKPGTFSFRICPPNNDAKSVGSVQDAKPSHSVAGAPPTLILPGGFSLIKMEPLPINPANVNAASNAAVILPEDLCMKKSISQDRSCSSEETCQDSKSSEDLLVLETSSSDLNEMNPVDLSLGNNTFPSKDVNKCESTDQNKESVSAVTDQMALQSKNADLYDWSPNAAEELMCAEEVVSADNDEISLENNIGDDFAGSPTEVDCISSDGTTTKALEDFPGRQDETAESPIVEMTLTPEQNERQKSPQGAVIKHNQEEVRDLPENMVKITDTPLISTANTNLENISKGNASFDVFELRVKGVYTETSQECPHLKPEDGGEGTKTNLIDTSNQSLAAENSSSAPKSVQIDSHSDPPEAVTNQHSGVTRVHSPLMNNQEANNYETPVSSKHGLLNTKLSNNPIRTQLLHIKAASKQPKDNNQNSHVGVPWSQRPVGSRPTWHHPDTPSKFNDDEDSSEEDSSDRCTEHSSDDSTSDSEETLGSSDSSSDEDGSVDIESVEDSQEQRFDSKMNDEARPKVNSKKACTFRGWKDRMMHQLARRQTHTENERQRRTEIQLNFLLLKRALDVEEHIKLSKQDLLNQAQHMILTLEGRNQDLEERKHALLQRQLTLLNKITELSDTKSTKKTHGKKTCEQMKKSEVQNQVKKVKLQINHQQVDRKGNKPSAQPGQWNDPDKRSKDSRQTSVPITAKVSALPKIVLQSFQKPDTVKSQNSVLTVQPTSTRSTTFAEPSLDQAEKIEIGDSSKGLDPHDLSKLASATSNLRKRRAEEPIKKEASPNTYANGSKLGLRSPVGTRMATRSTPTQKKEKLNLR